MALSPASNRSVLVGGIFLAVVAVVGGLWTFFGKDHVSLVAKGTSASSRVASGRGTSGAVEKRSIAACLADMAEGKMYPLPTRAQLEAYIEKEGRSAGSLIAGFLLSTEQVPWLEEAAERYPDDPRVSAMMLMTAHGQSATIEKWTRQMQQNDPGNSLGWCNAALNAFQAGDVETGLDALDDATQLGRPHMYPEDLAKEVTRACRSAGFDTLYSETLGRAQLPMGQLIVLMDLARQMNSDLEGGREPAVESILTLARETKQPVVGGTLLEQLVGSAMENTIAKSSEWYEEMPGLNMSAAEYLEKYNAERASISVLIKEHQRLLPSLSDIEMKQYLKRSAVEGELKAMQWVVRMKGGKS